MNHNHVTVSLWVNESIFITVSIVNNESGVWDSINTEKWIIYHISINKTNESINSIVAYKENESDKYIVTKLLNESDKYIVSLNKNIKMDKT